MLTFWIWHFGVFLQAVKWPNWGAPNTVIVSYISMIKERSGNVTQRSNKYRRLYAFNVVRRQQSYIIQSLYRPPVDYSYGNGTARQYDTARVHEKQVLLPAADVRKPRRTGYCAAVVRVAVPTLRRVESVPAAWLRGWGEGVASPTWAFWFCFFFLNWLNTIILLPS